MIDPHYTLRQLAGALDDLAEKHSEEARQFQSLDLPELAARAIVRALTLRAAMTEIVLLAEREEARCR